MRVDPTGFGRIVIDTNVWISAWLSRHGAPALLVRQVVQHAQPVFTRATFVELSERIWKPKFDRHLGMDYRRQLLHQVDAIAHWVEVSPGVEAQKYCRDPDDDKFIHAALSADARWLVTGDDDLLVLRVAGGTRILTPRAALDELDNDRQRA